MEQEVQRVVEQVLAELNPTLPVEQRIDPAPGTILIGEGATIDSLGLVNLTVSLEQAATDALGVSILLTEDPDIFSEDGPCRTIGSLVQHVAKLAGEQSGG